MSYRSYTNFVERVGKSAAILTAKIYLLTGDDAFLQEDCIFILSTLMSLKVNRVSRLTPSFFGYPQGILVVPAVSIKDWSWDKFLGVDRSIIIVKNDDEDLYQKVKKDGLVLCCNQALPYGKDLFRQIMAMSEVRGLTLSSQSVELLAERLGASSFKILSALNLLSKWKKAPTLEDIDRVLVYDREDEVFELVNLIAFGKSEKALIILKGMLGTKSEPLLIDWLLNFYQKLWVMFGIPENKRDEVYLSQVLGMGSHWVRRYRYLQKYYDRYRVFKAYKKVLEASRGLKKDRDLGIILTTLVISLGNI